MEEKVLAEKSKLREYKSVCFRLGLIMCVFYICRIFSAVVVHIINDISGIAAESAGGYAVQTLVLVVFVYALPLLFSAAILGGFRRYKENAGLLYSQYKKPNRLAKRLGNFPAVYGRGQGVNFLTILVFFLITVISARVGGGIDLQDFFGPVTAETPHNLASAFIMVFLIVIIAPFVEEFWVRGIIYDALKPFGNGIAILVSALVFGLMHGSIHMFFYTTVFGLALGYIRYATDSLFVVTILHLIINSIAAVMLFLLSLSDITGGENQLINSLVVVYVLIILVMVIIGIAAMIKKIPVIRKYKISNDWSEVSGKRKIRLFFASVPVIIMLLLAIDAHTNNFLLNKITEILR